MGTGYGSSQRAVLERLTEVDNTFGHVAQWQSVAELAGDGASRARRESLRRAVRSLERDGLVSTSYRVPEGRRMSRLHARLTGTGQHEWRWRGNTRPPSSVDVVNTS
jgi:hypothetical protein